MKTEEFWASPEELSKLSEADYQAWLAEWGKACYNEMRKESKLSLVIEIPEKCWPNIS